MSATITPTPPAVNAWNADYLETQYQHWKQDAATAPADLAAFFAGFDLARSAGAGEGSAVSAGEIRAHAGVASLIYHYRDIGHMCAALDPFGRERARPEQLTLAFHGLGEQQLDTRFGTGGLVDKPRTLRDIVEILEKTYCTSIGAEYMHLQSTEERTWLGQHMEKRRNQPNLDKGERVHLLHMLHRAEMFETFLHKRYVGQKRFSLEGAESLIPLLDRVVEKAADDGIDELVMGISHRGRLNVLNNILGKNYQQIFTEFEENWSEDFVEGGGDVKYHLGYSGDRETPSGKHIRVVLSSNPSHLEAVDAVVEGRCRAKQRLRTDKERNRTVPILVHGDAAFAGQGVVMEVLNLSQLEGYKTGGTIHVIVNNLIGFTTGPEDARSTRYCTDVAKMIEAPIFHVNGEDPESVVYIAQLALAYRQRYGKDVVIDMWCYRKWGHNEGDDPSFTQPIMARLIKKKSSVLKTYAERLLAERVITESDVQEIRQSLEEHLEKAQSAAIETPKDPTIDPGSWRWQGFTHEYTHKPIETGISRELLQEIAAAHERLPEGFSPHKNVARLIKKRADAVTNNDLVDWGTGEAYAFGSLLLEGKAIRLSGQDVRRGTFSHRHAVIKDMQTGESYTPLNNMRTMGLPGVKGQEPCDADDNGRSRQGRFCVYNSPLSEYSVLGFEYGYSLADPNMLVIWEAQFGDFANGAQIIPDQFLAPAELKWQRWSGLTMLLPHGYEGQGPEHSSARLERFLQLCADDNMEVVNPTTPAQFFHLLRRQAHRNFRKPLIVMTPKSLLRLPEATSPVDAFLAGGFDEILDDPRFDQQGGDRSAVKRVLLCSGKIFYELIKRREEVGRNDVAIVRVEQLYPLHIELLEQVLSRYPSGAERVWTQEEPENMGAYIYFSHACNRAFGWGALPYIGRDASATPATGSKKKHHEEQEAILAEAVGVKTNEPVTVSGAH